MTELPDNNPTVGLFPRRLKKQDGTRYFAWNFLELWRIGASGALTWFAIGLGVSWLLSLFMALETAELVFDYLFSPITLWFVALSVGAFLAKGMVVAEVGAQGVALSWGPIFFRKRLYLPHSSIERVVFTRWERQLNADIPGPAPAQVIEGFSPRFILRAPIEPAHLVQLPRSSERYSAKKPLVATDDGGQLWMYRRLKEGYQPLAETLGKYVTVAGDFSKEGLPQEAAASSWEGGDWLLSALLCGELAWLFWRLWG